MKKFLSLVLALIMTMSLVTISAGATEYRDLTDKDEIQYEEAVAVLNRIGVITGYEDGSFRPETELTRGAAAKIIVSLLIGPDAAANLPNATAPYPDVPASHTFAGVISYCKTAGIISGYGDGTFKPGNSLTGFAFAKMLLGALGYNSQIEGFVDTGWTMNVAKVGNVTGLFDRLDFDGAGAVNRETACQLALNTLKATMVTYGGTTMVTGAQTLAVQGTQAMYVTSNNREINANINRRVINATNNEMTLEFGEEHFKDLRLEHDKYDPAYDIYGHPSDEWSYKKVTIGTFPLPADFTFTKQMAHLEDSVATKEKALGLRNYDTYSTDHRNFTANWSTASSRSDWNSPFADATQITINGWNARAYNAKYVQTPAPTGINDGVLYTYDADTLNSTGSTVNASLKAQAPSIAEICDLTDNGVTVEVYVCPVDADYITNVVVTRTQLMKVKTIGSDFVRLDSIEPDSHKPYGAANGVNSGLGAITGYNAFAIDCTCSKWSDRAINDVKDDNYDAYNTLKDMKAGDYVAVVPYTADDGDTWEVGEAYAPETVSGRLTRVDIYNSEKKRDGNAIAITVGGTSYPINEWNKDMIDITDNIIKSTRKDVTVYLAEDGTALWATKVGNTDAWMVVGDYYQGTNDAGKIVWYVHGWTLSGEEVDLDLGTIRGAAEKYAPGELVRYEINTASGGGEYVLGKPNNNLSSVKRSGMYNHAGTPADPYVTPNTPVTGDFNDDQIKESARADSTKTWQEQWEGIYRVALSYGTNTTTGKAYDYNIDKGLDYIALDYYDAAAVTNTVSAADAKAPTAGYQWKVSTRYYDTNPTFIFVGFDSTGEVETIDFVKGRQDVRNEDLRDYNTSWRNVGTNSDNFVATTAEAYVNDNSKVEAVVIKTDSADADLSGIRIVTKSSGSNNNTPGAEETTSFTGKWNEREYVQGPDFNMSDAKVGVFDKGYNVGDILVGSEKDGIFYAKEFHGNIYRGNSLDGLWIKGIARITTDATKYLEDSFKILNAANVKTLDESKPATDFPEFADLMNAEDEPDQNPTLQPTKEAGLIRCVNAKIVDVRVGHVGEITKLKDLLDTSKYDLTQIELKVLFNGKKTDASFRNAYAVVILDAPSAKSAETAPVVTVDVDGDDVTVTGVDKYELPIGKKANLTALLDNAADMNDGVLYQWTVTSANAAKASLTGAKTAAATFKASEAGTYTVKLEVINPRLKKDLPGTWSDTITIKVTDGSDVATTAAPVVFTGDKLTNNLGVTITEGNLYFDGADTLQAKFKVKLPKWLEGSTATSVTFTGNIVSRAYGNVAEAASGALNMVSKAGTTGNVTMVFDDGSAGPVDISTANFASGDEKNYQLVITGMTFDKVAVKFVGADGTTELSAADLAKVSSTGAAMGAGNQVPVALATTSATGSVKFEYVSGVAAADESKKQTVTLDSTTTSGNLFTGAAVATGTDYVVVKVTGLDSLTEKVSITSTISGIFGGSGAKLADVTSSTAAGDTTTAVQLFAKKGSTRIDLSDSAVNAFDAGTEVELWAKLIDLNAGPIGVNVEVDATFTSGTGKATIKSVNSEFPLGTVKLDQTLALPKAKVTVNTISAPTVTAATLGNGKLTITFSTPVKLADGASISAIIGTVVAGAKSTADGGAATNFAVDATKEIEFTNGGTTLAIPVTGTCGSSQAGGTASSLALVANILVNNADDSLKLGAKVLTMPDDADTAATTPANLTV